MNFFSSEFMYAHLFMYGCFCSGILLFEDIFRCSAMSAFCNCANGTLQPKTLAFCLYGHDIKVVF